VRGSATLVPGQEAALGTMIEQLRKLNVRARDAGVRFRVVITGHTDADGLADRNLTLSRERAEAVVAAVPRVEFGALEFTAEGMGSSQPLNAGTTEADKQRNRRVAVRVEPVAGQRP
jgi:outer membrane protein OmpA-like peptidoglycan-associated protein